MDEQIERGYLVMTLISLFFLVFGLSYQYGPIDGHHPLILLIFGIMA